MATKTIPGEIKQQADAIVANFNMTVIQDPENFYVTRYRGLYLYLDRYDYGVLGQRCRLKFKKSWPIGTLPLQIQRSATIPTMVLRWCR